MIFRSEDVLGFRDGHFMAVGIPLVSLIMNFLLFGELLRQQECYIFIGCMFISLAHTAVFWIIFRSIYIEITRRYGGYDNIHQRYVIMIPTIIVIFAIIKLSLDHFADPLIFKYLAPPFVPDDITETLGSFIFIVLILSIYEGAHLFVELQESQLEKEQLIKANISSQLEGLKNQVNPHFLFNSLNTLASIIPDDQDKSIRFVSKLSKVYRYILDITDKKLVTIEEELKFLTSYTFLLEERFGENINININVPEHAKMKYIVPLSLQITFENAIKHNIISKRQPLAIDVYLEKEKYLVISNNLQKKKTIGVSPGLGLLNIKNRYKFYTHKEVKVMESQETFAVMLPLLTSAKFID